MIKISVEVSYPSKKPLSAAEEARMAEAIRKVLQPSIAQACCSVMRDAEPPEWDAEFIRSVRLEIKPTITIEGQA